MAQNEKYRRQTLKTSRIQGRKFKRFFTPRFFKKIGNTIHQWEPCESCGQFVRCGYCGNNCCNGGTRNLSAGSSCGCGEAYQLQYKGYQEFFLKFKRHISKSERVGKRKNMLRNLYPDSPTTMKNNLALIKLFERKYDRRNPKS